MSIENEFQSVKRERVSVSTVKQVVALVGSGRLPPGTRLPSEREMMELLGVSRNSYREAVRVLETMGVLRVEAGRGTWVNERPYSTASSANSVWLAAHEKDVADLLDVRALLEPRAAALAAARGGDIQRAHIAERMKDIQHAASGGDIEQVLTADTAFHNAIAEASGNRALSDVLAGLYESLRETRRNMMGSIPGHLRRQIDDHEPIVEAIVSRDPEAAARAVVMCAVRAQEAVRSFVHAGELLPRAGDLGTEAQRCQEDSCLSSGPAREKGGRPS